MAIVKDTANGKSHLYQLGASMDGGARLLAIKADRVIIGLGGSEQVIQFPHAGEAVAKLLGAAPASAVEADAAPNVGENGLPTDISVEAFRQKIKEMRAREQ
jgi:hypothetical protein